jgi:hypothetical protein
VVRRKGTVIPEEMAAFAAIDLLQMKHMVEIKRLALLRIEHFWKNHPADD